jgi:hypothetical protein
MKNALLLVLAVAVLGAGCARASADGVTRPARQSDVLTQEEIRGALKQNVHEVVSTLRPNWIRQRGQISFNDPTAGQVVVYINGVRVGGAEYLRQMSVLDVVSLRFVNSTEAGARFGIQQNGGAAILVDTRPGG